MNKSILKKSCLTMLALSAILSCGKDEEPIVAPNSAPVVKAQNFSASEGAIDSDILGTMLAIDAEGDSLTYSLRTNSSDLFEISAAGDLSLADGKTMDYATATSHKLSVDVSDGDLIANAEVTIAVVKEVRAVNIVGGLVAHFTFDNTLEDATGNIANAKIIGNVVPSENRDGEANKAFYLPAGAYLEIEGDSLMVDNDFEFSLAVWANADTRNSQQSLFSKAFDYQLLVTPAVFNLPTGDLYWGVGDDKGEWGESRKLFIDRAFLADRWHHYILIFTKDSVATYIDGALKSTIMINETTLQDSSTKILIGAKEYPSNGTIDNFFKGSIDDLRYYNKALTATEIATVISSY